MLRAAEVASYIARGTPYTAPQNIQGAQRESFITIEIPLEDGARGVIHRAPEVIVELETGDDGTLRNINTAAEWERYSVQSS